MIEFDENQRKTVSSALVVLSVAVVIAFTVGIVWAALKLVAFASTAVVPLILGFFLSLMFKPYYAWWVKLVRNPTLAVMIMLVTILAPLSLLVWTTGHFIVDQAVNLIRQGPDIIRSGLEWFSDTFPRLKSLIVSLGVPFDDFARVYSSAGNAAAAAGSAAVDFLFGCVSVLVTLVFFLFFLMTRERNGGEVAKYLPFLRPETQGFVAKQIDAFFEILVGFFRRQTAICLIEGCLYGTGFFLVGLPYGFLLGFVLGVLNLVPFFGSVVCLPIALPLAYFGAGGSALRLGLVAGVWVTGQLLDGYLITPKIQGEHTGLGYAGVIFSFLFWGTVLGPLLGMLLAIPLSAFCLVLGRALLARYVKPVV